MSQNYIFGYGSLIEDESRQRTTPTARDAWPVRVKRVRRGWWARGADSGMTTTYLGALRDAKKSCNGVIYEVTEEELQATDRRESAGYRREEIPTVDIAMLAGYAKPPDGKYWVYINTFSPESLDRHLPSSGFPIVQSYVDICINGCLEVQNRYPDGAKDFADEFIATTEEWSKYWVNDRIYPRRPFIFRPSAGQIDAVLQNAERTSQLVWEVELEPASWEQKKPVRPKKMAIVEPAPKQIACWRKGG